MMTAEFFLTMFITGIVLLGMSALIIVCFWDWYTDLWNKKLSLFYKLQWLIASFAFSFVAFGVLAWLGTLVGIILNAMYQTVL
jgi:uncharacterized membrane protein YqjE